MKKNYNSNRGFSLIEMAIAVMLVGGIMLVFSQVTSYVQRSSAQSMHYTEAQQNARIAVDFVTEALRKAGSGVESSRGQLGVVHAGPYQIAINGDFDAGQSFHSKPALSALYAGREGGSVPGVYAPPEAYHSGAETIVLSLDSNGNGLVSGEDQGDDAEEDIANRNLYLLKRYIYGFNGKSNESREANLALVRGPVAYEDGSMPPVLFEYIYDHDHADSTRDRVWGDVDLDGSLSDAEAAAVTPMPDSLLFFIRKIKVNIISESIKQNQSMIVNDGFAQVSMSSQVYVRNADRIEKSRIYGTVFYDADKDGTFDPGESGVPGVPILVDAGRRKAMTDAFGEYSIPLEPGKHTVSQVDLEGYTSSSSNFFEVDLVPGEMQVLDFGAYIDTAFGFIQGTAFEDLNENGVMDHDEVGIQGVLISLSNGMTTQTDENGAYTFTVPIGVYEVEEIDPEDFGSTTPNIVVASIPDQNSKASIDFGDKKGEIFGRIEGHVYVDLNENGRRDFQEQGLEGVIVSLSKSEAVFTDPEGYYVFEVAPGTYEITETDPEGYTSVSRNQVRGVVVEPDSTVTVNFGDILIQPLDFVEKVLASVDHPFALSVSDFKEDSYADPDIAVGMLSGGTSQIAVFNNMWEGSGTSVSQLFKSTASYTRDIASDANALLAVDLNADGKVDLISGHDYSAGSNVQVWLNSESGSLSSSASSSYSSGISSVVTVLSAGHLNEDSALDLVVGQSSSYGTFSGAFEILLGFTGGGLTPAVQFDYADAEQPIGNVAAAEIGDVDGDQDLDIVIGSNNGAYSGNIDVFENQGNGNFLWKARYPTGARINDLELVDSEGLGVLDLIAAVSTGEFAGGLQFWYNTAGDFGLLGQANDYLYGSSEAMKVEAAFLDDDIFPELIIGTRGPGQYMGEILVLYHHNEIVIGTMNIKQALRGEIVDLGVADFDKDGQTDIVATAKVSASQGELGIYLASQLVAP